MVYEMIVERWKNGEVVIEESPCHGGIERVEEDDDDDERVKNLEVNSCLTATGDPCFVLIQSDSEEYIEP